MAAAGTVEIVMRRTTPGWWAMLAVMLAVSMNVRAQKSENSASPWIALKQQLFGSREIVAEDQQVIMLDTPPRAEDPAMAPVTIRLGTTATSGPDRITRIYLIIDNNPSPLAVEFRAGPVGLPPLIGTRVRINAYTPMRAIAETDDGRLFMAEKLVKASGGCSASPLPANSGETGKMSLRLLAGPPAAAQVMVRHPSNTGLQTDPYTHDRIPPHFIKSVAVSVGGQLWFVARTDFSISQDPTFTFTLPRTLNGELLFEAMDSNGELYTQRWQTAGSEDGADAAP